MKRAYSFNLKQYVDIDSLSEADLAAKHNYADVDPKEDSNWKAVCIVKEHSRKLKKDTRKKATVKKHFRRLTNKETRKIKKALEKRENHYESLVHKLAKEVFIEGRINTLDVNRYCSEPVLLGDDFENIDLVPSNRVDDIETMTVETYDTDLSIQPDIVVRGKIDGVEQVIYVEIKYWHTLEEDKINKVRENNINCIEVPVDNYDKIEEDGLTENEIKDRLVDIISKGKAYWVECKLGKCLQDYIDKYYTVISTSSGTLKKSNGTNNQLLRGAYVFRSVTLRRFITDDAARTVLSIAEEEESGCYNDIDKKELRVRKAARVLGLMCPSHLTCSRGFCHGGIDTGNGENIKACKGCVGCKGKDSIDINDLHVLCGIMKYRSLKKKLKGRDINTDDWRSDIIDGAKNLAKEAYEIEYERWKVRIAHKRSNQSIGE